MLRVVERGLVKAAGHFHLGAVPVLVEGLVPVIRGIVEAKAHPDAVLDQSRLGKALEHVAPGILPPAPARSTSQPRTSAWPYPISAPKATAPAAAP